MFGDRKSDRNQMPAPRMTLSPLHSPDNSFSSPDTQSLSQQSSILSARKADRLRQLQNNTKQSIWRWLIHVMQWDNGSLFYILVWFAWLLIGTIFYAYVDFNKSFFKGFYFAVNVGYSIGFGVLDEKSDASKAFSIVYLLVGAIFVSRWLAYLIEIHILENENNSIHEQIAIRQNVRQSCKLLGWQRDVYVWIVMNYSKLFVIYMWFIYVCFGTGWTCGLIGWSFTDGVYFAISAMSTGGLQGIPDTSPDYAFFIVGLFACTGVPLMGMAVSNLATLILQAKDFAAFDQHQIPHHKLSDAEKEILQLMKASRGKNVVLDRNEYLIMQLIRNKKLTAAKVASYYQEFAALDKENRGVVAVSKLRTPRTSITNLEELAVTNSLLQHNEEVEGQNYKQKEKESSKKAARQQQQQQHVYNSIDYVEDDNMVDNQL
jgi:hypothetical protein